MVKQFSLGIVASSDLNTLVEIETNQVWRNVCLQIDALLVIPSTPSLPPSRAARGKELEIFESRALSILSIATMAGCCQVRFVS